MLYQNKQSIINYLFLALLLVLLIFNCEVNNIIITTASDDPQKPPEAPENITYTSPTTNSLVLSWSIPSDPGNNSNGTIASITNYVLQYSNSEGEWSSLSTNSTGIILSNAIGTNTSATVMGLTAGTTYGFRVIAVNIAGESTFSEPIIYNYYWPEQIILNTNSLYLLSTSNTVITATFLPSYATNTNISWISSDTNLANISSNGNNTVTITAISVGTVNITARVVNKSASLTVTVLPNSPQNFQQTNFIKSTEVDLVWDFSQNINKYEIYQVTPNGTNKIADTAGTSFSVTELNPNTYYLYKIKACAGDLCSPPSSLLTVTGSYSEKNLALIISNNQIPDDLTNYDEASQDIFDSYASSAAIVSRYVLPGGKGNKSGNDWANAAANLKDLLEGITDAGAGKVYAVLVGPGEYAAGKEMQMKNYVTIVGSVSVNNTIPVNSSVMGITTLSGNNSYRVFYNNNITNTSRLHGVTIADGNVLDYGAGMYNFQSSPSLSRVIFIKNKSPIYGSYGGGMANNNSSPVLDRVIFFDNYAEYGGGMFNTNKSFPKLRMVNIFQNKARWGGGMYNKESSPKLSNVVFSQNEGKSAGAIYNAQASPELYKVIFVENFALENGAGIRNQSGSPTINSVAFFNNSASNGGALYNYPSENLVLNKVVLSGNKSLTGSVFIRASDTIEPSALLVVNSVFENNRKLDSTLGHIYFENVESSSSTLSLFNSFMEGGMPTDYISGTTVAKVEGGGFSSSGSQINITINFDRIITNMNNLPNLIVNDKDGVSTYTVTGLLPANNQLQVKRSALATGGTSSKPIFTFYYSSDGNTWYTNPALSGNPALPNDTIDFSNNSDSFQVEVPSMTGL